MSNNISIIDNHFGFTAGKTATDFLIYAIKSVMEKAHVNKKTLKTIKPDNTDRSQVKAFKNLDTVITKNKTFKRTSYTGRHLDTCSMRLSKFSLILKYLLILKE